MNCEECGRLDSSIRFSVFTYVMSFLIITTREVRSGIHCRDCRDGVRNRCNLTSVTLGWWGIPWGPFYTIKSLVSNSKVDADLIEVNADLLVDVADQLLKEDNDSEAERALEASLELRDDSGVRQLLLQLRGEAILNSPPEAPTVSEVESEISPIEPGIASFSPGDSVVPALDDVQLRSSPNETGEVVGAMGAVGTVLSRPRSGWVEVRAQHGASGWTLLEALEKPTHSVSS